MEFLVEFELNIPEGTPDTEIEDRQAAEEQAAGRLADEGHLLRVWKSSGPSDGTQVVGLYLADDAAQLGRLLEGLPLYDWMRIVVTPLAPHPNDPAAARTAGTGMEGDQP
jgi:muconolactone D-isomerase